MTTEQEIQVTDAAAWKAAAGALGQPTELPSGVVVRIKAPGMEMFLRSGAIPNSLMDIIMSQLEAAKEDKEPDLDAEKFLRDMKDDPGKLQDLMVLIDNAVVASVVQPKVYPIPEADEERSDEHMYVDEVDLEDKFFIFNFAVGGTKDLEQFRGEFASSVESIQLSAEVENNA